MEYCQKCETEYERGEDCMCPQYKRYMESGQEHQVPTFWRNTYWDYGLGLCDYCDACARWLTQDGIRVCQNHTYRLYGARQRTDA